MARVPVSGSRATLSMRESGTRRRGAGPPLHCLVVVLHPLEAESGEPFAPPVPRQGRAPNRPCHRG